MPTVLRRLVLIVTLSSFLYVGLVSGQEQPDSNQEVIQLRSSSASGTQDGTSRTGRTSLADPSKIQFDEIQNHSENTFQGRSIPKNLVLKPNLHPSKETNTQPVKPPVTSSLPAGPSKPSFSLSKQDGKPSIPVINAGWTKQPARSATPVGLAKPITVTSIPPMVTTRLIAPRFVNLDQVAPIRIQLQNTSDTGVSQVKLVATLPSHARFVAAKPQPTSVNGHRYEFLINQIAGNQKQEVQIDVVPTQKKPLSVETHVSITNGQNVEVAVRQPNLHVRVAGSETSHTGKQIDHVVTIEKHRRRYRRKHRVELPDARGN